VLPELPGALILAVSLVALSGLVATLIPRVSPPLARGLLIVSALAPLLPMALACAYALREQYPAVTLTIAQMVRFHGLVNAIGFVLCGLLAWTIDQLAVPGTAMIAGKGSLDTP
jgi:YndJ-like protein